jgi:FtsH-binding integral membrane protein
MGLIVSYVDQTAVLQALVITLFTFLGLTLFTFQSKYDFSKMGPWLFGGLLFIVGAGFVQVFLPFNHVTDMAMAAGGCVIFSGYIVYDTHLILKRLSPEEWVLAVLSL